MTEIAKAGHLLAEENNMDYSKPIAECKMCEPYGRPGWIVNARQWVRCFDCNPSRFRPSGRCGL